MAQVTDQNIAQPADAAISRLHQIFKRFDDQTQAPKSIMGESQFGGTIIISADQVDRGKSYTFEISENGWTHQFAGVVPAFDDQGAMVTFILSRENFMQSRRADPDAKPFSMSAPE